MDIKDLGGQEDLKNIRLEAYKGTDVIVLCYSLDEAASVDCLVTMWLEEIAQAGLEAPKLLIGCKSDIEKKSVHDKCTELIKTSQRFSEAQHLKCSAKQGENITDVFYEIIPTHLNRDEIMETQKPKAKWGLYNPCAQ